MRDASSTCNVPGVETIGERIARLRNAKGWSRPELGRQMALALQRKKPFSGEVVRLYEEDENRPGKEARRALALVFQRSESYLEFGDSPQRHKAASPTAAYAVPQNAREEIALELFRGLTPEQQREQVKELRAAYEANRQVQTFLPSPLRTYSNEDVEAAFGKVPAPRKRPVKKRSGPTIEDDPE